MTSKECIRTPQISEMVIKGRVRAGEYRRGNDGWCVKEERIGMIVTVQIIDDDVLMNEIMEVLKDTFQRTIQSFLQFC